MKAILIATVLLLVISTALLGQGVPESITYQGKLTDINGLSGFSVTWTL